MTIEQVVWLLIVLLFYLPLLAGSTAVSTAFGYYTGKMMFMNYICCKLSKLQEGSDESA